MVIHCDYPDWIKCVVVEWRPEKRGFIEFIHHKIHKTNEYRCDSTGIDHVFETETIVMYGVRTPALILHREQVTNSI